MLKILVTADYGANHWVLEFPGNYDTLLTLWGTEWIKVLESSRRELSTAEKEGLWGAHHRLYEKHESANPEWSYRVQGPYLGSRSGLAYGAWLSHLRYSLNYFDAEVFLNGPGDSSLKIGDDIYDAPEN